MMKRSVEPNYEIVVGLVRHMSAESLKELINNDEKVEQIINDSQQCRDLENEKEIIMAQSKSLAEYNMSLSPKLENGKTRLKELCESVQKVRDNVEELQSQLKNNSGDLSCETVLALLRTAAAESEEESEKIAEKFYQKDIEVDEFLDQFQTFRKLMHLRRVKADKMREIMVKKDKAGTFVPTPKYPNVPYPTASVPYPIGGMNMPYFPMAK